MPTTKWAAANLPALSQELGVLDHLPTFADVVQQPIRRRPLATTQADAPVQQLLPGRFVTVVLEGVQQLLNPLLAGRVVLPVNLTSRFVSILAEVVEVQAQVI